MKRISIYMLSTLFLAAAVSACGKTTKGKMTNEWRVTSMQSVDTYESPNGSKHVSTTSMTESTVTETDEYYFTSAPSTTETETGMLKTNEMIIKKDGTWSWIIDATYTTSNGTHQEKLEQSGSWSFLDRTKGDDFKKNERILFNVLALTASDVETENGVEVYNVTDNLTYTTGKSTMIYTVIESKKDKLELEMDAKNASTQNSNMNTISNYRKIVLEAK